MSGGGMNIGDWVAAAASGVAVTTGVATWVGVWLSRKRRKKAAAEQAGRVMLEEYANQNEVGFQVVNRGESPVHDVELSTNADGGDIFALSASRIDFGTGAVYREKATRIPTIDPASARAAPGGVRWYQLLVAAQPVGPSSDQIRQTKLSFRDATGDWWQRLGNGDPTKIKPRR